MGYMMGPEDFYSFHHLIIPSCKKGPYIESNGAILFGNSSHPYLHVIENIDYDMFLAITSELIDELIKGYLDKDNLLRIRDILNSFEREYLYRKCNYKIKEAYLIRPSIEEVMIRKRML